jgi:riboflavin synthase
LQPTTRLGGHLVSGHVDGVGEIVERRADGRSVRFTVRAPERLARYIAEKGSICIDGISLTVNGVHGAQFDLNIVPHTLEETTLHAARVGQKVNLEVDVIARYLERLLLGDEAAKTDGGGITRELLARQGFLQD